MMTATMDGQSQSHEPDFFSGVGAGAAAGAADTGVWGCYGALGSSYGIGSSFVGYYFPAAFNALIRISTAKTAAVHASARNTPHFL